MACGIYRMSMVVMSFTVPRERYSRFPCLLRKGKGGWGKREEATSAEAFAYEGIV